MKSFLSFLVAMGIVVTLGDAYCFHKMNKPDEPKDGCMLHGRLYPFGLTERTEDCFSCRCNAVSMRCCSLFHTPVGYDRKNCKVVFNKETCNYDVVRKNDPSKECVVYSSIG